jgi:DNA invertase Pin-like site-specific DNA recombinase
MSGSRAERPGLTQAQNTLRKGDTLVVWKLDPLGRSVKHLIDLVGELQEQGVHFKESDRFHRYRYALGSFLLPCHGQLG